MSRLFKRARLPDGRIRDVRVSNETIAAVSDSISPDPDETVVDARDKFLFPGAIDAHVHFREPGDGHKETWTTGSKSAAAGGVTTIVDQPNTNPPTIEKTAYTSKATLATDSIVDYGINGGVTPDWKPDSLFECPLFALGEVFLADSTGEMGIDETVFRQALVKAAEIDIPVTIHAEDATQFNTDVYGCESGGLGGEATADMWSQYRSATAEIDAIKRAITIATEVGADIHIAHTSTPAGVDAATANNKSVTCEVTPHHLFLSRDDAAELGTYGRMNPPLRSETRRQGLWDRLVTGDIDMIATDHAPHTYDEKATSLWDAPSGVPGVETMLPLLFDRARRNEISYERIRDVTARNPASRFGLTQKGRIAVGYDADLVLIDPTAVQTINSDMLHSKCTWTPFAGMNGVFPELTMVRGTVVYDGETFGPAVGMNVIARE
jgi:dihydroorotase, multifunctional complex type